MRAARLLAGFLALSVVVSGCGDDGEGGEMAALEYDVRVSAPRFVVPSAGLPPEVEVFHSNNNVDILFHEDRLFMAWRSAPNHFAGADTRMYIVSSLDGGVTWEFEHSIHIGADMREPRFLAFGGALQLMFFEAGDNPGAFEPRRMVRTRRIGFAEWSPIEILTDAGEVPWDVKVHDGVAYLTSYMGEHYGAGETSEVSVFFKESHDGTTWTPVGGHPFVYFGGVSEVAFEFDREGNLWAVTRNEDGDQTGFGSHVCFAPAGSLGTWECPEVTDPERYDSPEMFRHEGEIYLVARRDIGGPYDRRDTDLTLAERRSRYLIEYSLRPKRTALYRIDRETRSVVHVLDLPGAGDTAFPSVQQSGPHTFLLANYTSPLDDPDVSWLRGQTSSRGTQLYLAEIEFVPYTGPPREPTPTRTPTVRPTPTPRSDVDPSGLTLSPVFAAPEVPLAIGWPAGEDVVGLLDLGDGTRVNNDTTSHLYPAGGGIYSVQGSVERDDGLFLVSGTVARAGARFVTPLNGFTLTDPSEPIVQQVIRGIIPAFYWVFDGSRLAFATDPTGQADLDFTRVVATGASLSPDGAFVSEPADFVAELSGGAADATGQFIEFLNAVAEGTMTDGVFSSPIELRGELVTADIVAVAAEIAGLEPEAAVEFMAGLFGFDPTDPPETIPFRADLTIQPEA